MLDQLHSVLLASPLFAGFDEAAVKELLPCFCAIQRSCRKGDILCQAGEPQTAIGIVLSGEVQVQKEDHAGNRLIIGTFGPGELFGEVSAFAGSGQWPNTVMANAQTSVLFVPYLKLSQPCCRACEYHQRLIRNMLNIVAGKAMIMNNRISFIKLKGMREKLTAYLYEQYLQNKNKTFQIPMDRESLADFLNVSRPSMSRELSRMQDEGIIEYFRSSFTIRDLAALRKT